MVGQTQRVEGWPYGECVAASWATVIGCPIDAVPRFDPGFLGEASQIERERAFARTLGFDLVRVPASTSIPSSCVHFTNGLSPRGPFGHRVVGVGGQIAWDPHPSRAGVRKVFDHLLFVPLLDAELREPETDLLGFAGWLQ